MLDLENIKYPALYNNVRTAIAACHKVDECKAIANKAQAMATYYKLVKDDESVRKFYEIKLRSWRRIGELLSQVDTSDCSTKSAKYARIREEMKDPVTQSLSDPKVSQLLRLAALPAQGFEQMIDKCRGSIEMMLAVGDPEENARRKASLEESGLKSWGGPVGAGEADEEVGFTLDVREREEMRDFHFLIKAGKHEQLRRAAFDHRTTMWAILREGLDMWFQANGYPGISEEDIGISVPRRRRRGDLDKHAG